MLAQAEILDDHGPLGVGGRRFYTILLQRNGSEDVKLDYPEDEMEPLPAGESAENDRP
jgi:hypothetical protein